MNRFLEYADEDQYDLIAYNAPSYATIKFIYGLTSLLNLAFLVLAFFYMGKWWHPFVVCFILPGVLSGFFSNRLDINMMISQLGCFVAPILSIISIVFLVWG